MLSSCVVVFVVFLVVSLLLFFISVLFWVVFVCYFFFFSSRRRHTRLVSDWSSDVCSSDLAPLDTSGYFFMTSAISESGFITPVLVSLWTIVMQSYFPVERRLSISSGRLGEIGRASCRERV